MKVFNIGDRVRYSATFLRSIGCYSGTLPFARGTITAVKNYSKSFAIATIDWQNPDVPEKVNVGNLERCK
jgi:hypothetical protein